MAGDPNDIRILDPHRLLFGEAPWPFLFEAAVRAVLIYAVLTVVMRLLGKRMSAQVSRSELAVLVTLGAAIGAPINAPDRGLLPAFAILMVAVLFQRGISYASFRRRRVEILVQGDVETVVADGEILLSHLRRNVLSQERLFSQLRRNGIYHLGEIERCYLEAEGNISLYKHKTSRPGLSILPSGDDFLPRMENCFACGACGHLKPARARPTETCPRCRASSWNKAVAVESEQENDRALKTEG